MTSTEARPTWSERWNPRNWTLAWKLVAIGVVPALLALVLGVLRVADQAGAAADLGRSSRLLEVRNQVAGVANTLRQERDEATLFVASGRVGDQGVLDIGFKKTDGEVDAMLAAVRSTELADPGSTTARQSAESGVANLRSIRADATGASTTTPVQVRDLYSSIITSVDTLDRALLRLLRTPDTAGLADALTAATESMEQLSLQHTDLGTALRLGRADTSDINVALTAEAQLLASKREFQLSLSPEQFARAGDYLDVSGNGARDAARINILDALNAGRPPTVTPNEWDDAYAKAHAAIDKSTKSVGEELVATSTAAEQRASNLAGINSVVLMLGLLIGITIAVLIARALIRSLRVLRTSALDVAERRLPQAVESMRAGESPDVAIDPVPLSSRDEVGQVARAFDAVHGQAVRLAAEQAVTPVERQRDVRQPVPPQPGAGRAAAAADRAAGEQRAGLRPARQPLPARPPRHPHAAQQREPAGPRRHRPRRSATRRRSRWSTSCGAAVSEVEQYQRIVVQAPPTATIVGRAASDLVHLLAELLDNATNFSPPDSQVVMSTTRTPDGADGHRDRRPRRRHGRPRARATPTSGCPGLPAVDVSASRRMGLFVVGRLGTRHGIGVRLSSSAAGGPTAGLTASVTVPTYLIPSSEPAEVAHSGARPGMVGGMAPPPIGTNGSGRPGSLSALVAGTDGPANPAGVFDAAGTDGPLFAAPPQASNGSAPPPVLPSRRPGSTLRPDGPGRPPTGTDPAEQAAADQRAAEQRAREVAEQARRDQEAAERAARERTAKEQAAAQEREARERAEQERVEQERAAAQEREAQAKAVEEREAQERAAMQRAAQERADRERAAQERDAQARAAQERAAQERAAQEANEVAFAEDAPPAEQAAQQPGVEAGSDPASQGNGLQLRPFLSRLELGGRRNGGSNIPANGTTPPEAVQREDVQEPPTEAVPQTSAEAPSGAAEQPLVAAEAEVGEESATAVAEQPAADESPTGIMPAVRPAPRPQPQQPQSPPQQGESEASAVLPPLPRPRPFRPRPNPGTPGLGPNAPAELPRRGVPQPSADFVAPAPPTTPMPIVAKADVAQPPVAQPPVAQPPVAQPPVAQPPVAQPPVAQPPSTQQPAAELGVPQRPEVEALQGPETETPRPEAAGTETPREESASPDTALLPIVKPAPQQVAQPEPTTSGPQVPQQAAAPQAAAPAPAPASDADELFAPAVPVIAEPSAASVGNKAFDMGETTPIFEEIASAWFRSNRPVPVNWETDGPGLTPPPLPSRAPRPMPSPMPAQSPSPMPSPVPVKRTMGPAPAPTPSPAPVPTPPPVPVAAVEQSAFATTADEGWRAASSAVEAAERSDELTAAGLPKRRPRARLVPGSAGSAVLAPPVSSSRSAETIRGRLASYQQGVRQGRESRQRGESDAADTGTTPATAGGHDEELS